MMRRLRYSSKALLQHLPALNVTVNNEPTFFEMRMELEALIGAEATAAFSKTLDWNDVTTGATARLRAQYLAKLAEARQQS
jgi:3,4-dihydroxy-2-butanone 4-phosphate synthase